EDEAVEYNDIGYFFEADNEESNEKYTVLTTKDQLNRQLYAQYPPASVVDRSVVMACFDDESNERINRSWTNVRCFDLNKLFGRK
ncbi:MAG: spermidine/putrescine ABC transporter substrate-binding protein, partial [Lachnospiraceae bacterium]|nr:spermidine/putrescine ABC transporter substrate-binding protein [Lachnospiraceae bacterium]